MIAAEVVKIKVDQQIGRKNEVEFHAFVFHDKLNQLKSDIKKKWLSGCKMTNVTDIKKFIEQFSNRYELKPEHQSQLEEYKDSSEDFKMTLKSLASRMNQSGKTHVILIDEVNLKNVLSQDSSMENNLEVDLSYISEYIPSLQFLQLKMKLLKKYIHSSYLKIWMNFRMKELHQLPFFIQTNYQKTWQES